MSPRDTRERVLDVTQECLRELGIRRTTMAAVAERAGVSRAWLYRLFPDRASLVGAALVRFDEAFWADAHARVARQRGIVAQVAEAVLLSRSVDLPLGLALREAEPEAYALVVGTGLRDVVPGMAGFWTRHLQSGVERGDLRADLDVARAAEHVLRLVLSLVTVPGDAVDPDDRRSLSAYLSEFLLPALVKD